MSRTPATAEQRAVIQRRLNHYRELEPLCHNPENLRDLRRAIAALVRLLELGIPD